MVRAAITKEESSRELKVLRQRVAELEAREAEHQQANKKSLRLEDEQRYKAVFESAKDVIVLMDKKGRITDVNDNLREIIGYDKEKLVGKNLSSLPNIMTKKSLDILSDKFQKRVAGACVPPYEIEMVKKNGESITLEINARVMKQDGKIVGELAILRDVTERDETARALKESEERLRIMMEASSEGFVLHDGDKVFDINENGARMFGCTRSEMVGENAPDFVAPESLDLVQKNIAAHYIQPYEALFKKKDGSTFPVEIRARNIVYKGRDVRLVSFRDLTAQKQYENLLETISVHAPVSMSIAQSGRFQFVNKQFCRNLGYTQEEILSMDVMQSVHPEDRVLVRSNAIQMLKGERTEPFEFRAINKDGDTRWVLQSVASITYNGQRASLTTYLDFTEQRKIELALRESEQNLKKAQALGRIGSWEFDLATQKIGWSDEVYRLYGRDKALGPPSPEEEAKYYTPEQTRILREYALLSVETGKEYNYDLTANLPSGKTLLLNASVHPIKDELGQVIKLFGTVQDITERKQAETELRLREEKLRSIFSTAPVGIGMTTNRLLLEFNDHLCEMTGYTREELFEKRVGILYASNDVYEAARERIHKEMAQKGSSAIETRWRQKDGKLIDVLVNAVPLKLPSPLEGMTFTVMNITERKKAEQTLQESEQRYRLLADNATDIVWTMDLKTQKFNYSSPSVKRILGYTPAELMEITLKKTLTPDSYEYGMKVLAEELERDNMPGIDPDRIRTLQVEEICKDGSIIPIEVRIKFLRDANGLPTYVIGITRDMTEHKLAEEALKNSEERFRRLAENARDIIFRYRQLPSLGFDYISPAVLCISGYAPEEFYADPLLLFKVVHPDSRSFLEEITSRPQDYLDKPIVLRWTHKNGEAIWTEQRSVPIYDTDGKIIANEGIIRDVTERKQMEEEVQRNYDTQTVVNALLKVSLEDLPLEEILRRSLDLVLSIPWLTLEQRGAIFLVEGEPNVLVMKAQSKLAEPIQKACARMPFGRCLCGRAALTNETQFADCLNERHEVQYEGIIPHGHYCIPITSSGKVLGVINTYTKEGHSRDKKEEAFLTGVANTLAGIIERKRAEEALKTSEENYRNSMDSSPMGVVIFDGNEEILYANQAILDIYGFKNIEELRNTPIEERYTPESYAEYLVRSAKFKSGELTSLGYELRVKRKDGYTRHLQAFRKEIIWNGDKQFQLLYNDITERKRAEDAMRESRARFRELAMLLPQSVWETDENGIVTYTNEATMRLYGYTRQDTAPLNYLQNLIPEDRDRAARNTQRLLQGDTLGGIEYTGLRKDSGTFPVMIYGSAIFRNGKGVGLRGITIDITEQKRAEKRLEQAAQEWRVTFDSLTDMVCILDNDFRVTRVNMAYANMLKKEPRELIGEVCYKLIHKTDCPHQDCPHQKTLQTEKPAWAEYFESSLGTYFEASTSPIFNEKGEVKGSVCVMRDISERKQMEQQLMLTDRLASVGELASGVAHELNNPLTSVIGFSQLLMEGEIPAAIKEDLSLINSEAQRAASIVKNLLTFARKHAAVKQSTRINNVIEDVLKLRAYEQKVNNIEVIKKFAPDLPEIMVDYFQIQQVFLNLIINAEFFMTEAHRRGTLAISIEKVNHAVKVSFADDGPGIPQENLKRIFDPFFTTKEVGKGTGLGLSICHGVITSHGGRIYAESEVGKGAAFIVELPIIDR